MGGFSISLFVITRKHPAPSAKGQGFFVQGLREAPVYSNEVPGTEPIASPTRGDFSIAQRS